MNTRGRPGLVAPILAVLAGCIDTIPSQSSFVVSGRVVGLVGQGLELRLDGGERLTPGRNGLFGFTARVDDGATYRVEVTAQPSAPAQRCVVFDGEGVVRGGDVSAVTVACSLVAGTFNLEWFGPTSSDGKKTGIAGAIRAGGYGLLAVEEVSGLDALRAFASAYLGPDWDARLGTSGGTQRVGFLYRPSVLTVLDAGELDAQRSGGLIDPASATWNGLRLPYWARVATVSDGAELELVAVHFKAYGDSSSCATRAAQVASLDAWLATRDASPVMVTGDFNDEITGNGICGSVDTLAPFESDTRLTFLTAQPANMADTYYTNIGYRSTIDHVMVTTPLLGRVATMDAEGHKAAVVMHGNEGASDHQPPYVWLAW